MLSPISATFVDVIHTNGGNLSYFPSHFGLLEPRGHLDFYPGGGQTQPGCEESAASCSHSRAIHYFLHSIRQPDLFPARLCHSVAQCAEGVRMGMAGQLCSLVTRWQDLLSRATWVTRQKRMGEELGRILFSRCHNFRQKGLRSVDIKDKNWDLESHS